ncbi:unnamed protein product, partial [Prorocentrum cordatum]
SLLARGGRVLRGAPWGLWRGAQTASPQTRPMRSGARAALCIHPPDGTLEPPSRLRQGRRHFAGERTAPAALGELWRAPPRGAAAAEPPAEAAGSARRLAAAGSPPAGGPDAHEPAGSSRGARGAQPAGRGAQTPGASGCEGGGGLRAGPSPSAPAPSPAAAPEARAAGAARRAGQPCGGSASALQWGGDGSGTTHAAASERMEARAAGVARRPSGGVASALHCDGDGSDAVHAAPPARPPSAPLRRSSGLGPQGEAAGVRRCAQSVGAGAQTPWASGKDGRDDLRAGPSPSATVPSATVPSPAAASERMEARAAGVARRPSGGVASALHCDSGGSDAVHAAPPARPTSAPLRRSSGLGPQGEAAGVRRARCAQSVGAGVQTPWASGKDGRDDLRAGPSPSATVPSPAAASERLEAGARAAGAARHPMGGVASALQCDGDGSGAALPPRPPSAPLRRSSALGAQGDAAGQEAKSAPPRSALHSRVGSNSAVQRCRRLAQLESPARLGGWRG